MALLALKIFFIYSEKTLYLVYFGFLHVYCSAHAHTRKLLQKFCAILWSLSKMVMGTRIKFFYGPSRVGEKICLQWKNPIPSVFWVSACVLELRIKLHSWKNRKTLIVLYNTSPSSSVFTLRDRKWQTTVMTIFFFFLLVLFMPLKFTTISNTNE